MNKTEAHLILNTATKNSIPCEIKDENEIFEVIIKDGVNFKSFEAARLAINAFILEKQFIAQSGNSEINTIEPEFMSLGSEVLPGETKVVLKINNRETILDFPTILIFTSKAIVYKVQNIKFQTVNQVIESCGLEAGENPIYVTGTKNYSGFLLAAFENGKVAKITMKSYVTEFNRKKLKNAFNNESSLVFIEHFETDTDLVAISSLNKVVMFNTAQVSLIESRTTKGIQVMKSKDHSFMLKIKKADQVKFADPEYYRRKEGLNVLGFYLKPGDEI